MRPGRIPCARAGPPQTTTRSSCSDHTCGAQAPPDLSATGAGWDRSGRNRTDHSNTENEIEIDMLNDNLMVIKLYCML